MSELTAPHNACFALSLQSQSAYVTFTLYDRFFGAYEATEAVKCKGTSRAKTSRGCIFFVGRMPYLIHPF